MSKKTQKQHRTKQPTDQPVTLWHVALAAVTTGELACLHALSDFVANVQRLLS